MPDKPAGYVIIVGTYYNETPHTFRAVRTLEEADTVMRSAGYVKFGKKRLRWGELRYYENDAAGYWARVHRSEAPPTKEV